MGDGRCGRCRSSHYRYCIGTRRSDSMRIGVWNELIMNFIKAKVGPVASMNARLHTVQLLAPLHSLRYIRHCT